MKSNAQKKIIFKGTLDECIARLRIYQRTTRAGVIAANTTFDEDGKAHPSEDIEEKINLCDRRVVQVTLKELDAVSDEVTRDAFRSEVTRMRIEQELFLSLYESTTNDDGQ